MNIDTFDDEPTTEHDMGPYTTGYWDGLQRLLPRELDYELPEQRRGYRVGYAYGTECRMSGGVK